MNMPCLVFFGIATAIPLPAQNLGSSSFTGAPYSATQISERLQTLADGTHITQPGQKTVIYRDSAGRTRNESTFTALPRGAEPALTRVSISDPVAGFRYELNSKDKVAQRFAMPVPRPAITQPAPVQGISTQNVIGKQGVAPSTSSGFSGSGASGDGRRTTSELLGTQVIEGVSAEGGRTTTTWAVGSVGNDREIVATRETWYSRELGAVMLMKTSDPRSGDTTTRLTDISRVEPNPALFMPPVDYTIKDVGTPPAP